MASFIDEIAEALSRFERTGRSFDRNLNRMFEGFRSFDGRRIASGWRGSRRAFVSGGRQIGLVVGWISGAVSLATFVVLVLVFAALPTPDHASGLTSWGIDQVTPTEWSVALALGGTPGALVLMWWAWKMSKDRRH